MRLGIEQFAGRIFIIILLCCSSVFAAEKIGEEFIYLDGAKATLTGKGVAIQEGYIRNWDKPGSGVQWKFRVPVSGKYSLFCQSSSPSSQGGTMSVMLDGVKHASIPAPSTRDFNDFRMFHIAGMNLTEGEHTLAILAESLKDKFLMDIKFVILSTYPELSVVEKAIEEQRERKDSIMNGDKGFASDLKEVRETLPLLWLEAGKEDLIDGFKKKYPHQTVWLEQDSGEKINDFLEGGVAWKQVFESLIKTSPDAGIAREKYRALEREGENSLLWAEYYESLAWERRQSRLDKIRKFGEELIFAKHHVFGSVSGIYLITETEGNNQPSYLCTLNLKEEKPGKFAKEKILVDPGEGMVRNPELSYDAKRLLYAMRPTKKHFDSTHTKLAYGVPEMNYQIYEMDLETGKTRALTSTETYGSSFEPCYLPNGDIIFSSARIVQHITCGWGDHSNLFIMNKDGKYARRVGFDQTNTAYPVVLNDGRVIFTRRDYNDRGQSSAHALFQMYSDGTGQTEFYGNQTGLPNSFHHARPIPGSTKVITIIGGYHTTQGGKLAIIAPRKGVEKDEGLIEIPGYKKPRTGDEFDDFYGKQGVQYSYPYALTEKDYIVSIAERNHRKTHYGLYYLNDMGERELLASDPETSCLEGIMKIQRPCPPTRPTFVDYSREDGVFYVQNVYHGEAAKGIKPGSVKKLRVVEILYKNTTIGTSKGEGPGGRWDTVMPTGNGLASFDSKRILGDATVYEDGSAMFKCPARKPIYFQLLDEQNRVVQTMRSWATLMPGENFSCVGCHENKNEAPMSGYVKTIAFTKGAEELSPFYGHPRAFSFIHEVQPVFDKHCISCHRPDGEAKQLLLTAEPYMDDEMAKKRFYQSYYSLTNARPENGHSPEEFGFYPDSKIWGKRKKGHKDEDEPNRYVSWYTRFELMKPYPPYRAGSIKSGLVKILEKGHKDVKLSQEELDKIRAWIDLNIPFAGEYDESNLWNDSEKQLFRSRVNERLRNERIEARDIRQFIKDGQPY